MAVRPAPALAPAQALVSTPKPSPPPPIVKIKINETPSDPLSSSLKPGWHSIWNVAANKHFYHNRTTKEKTWEAPIAQTVNKKSSPSQLFNKISPSSNSNSNSNSNKNNNKNNNSNSNNNSNNSNNNSKGELLAPWTCSVCTYKNEKRTRMGSKAKCEMCNNVRQQLVVQMTALTPSSASQQNVINLSV